MQVEIQEDKLHEVQAEYDGPGEDFWVCDSPDGCACRGRRACRPAS